ncbi:ATP-dependent DNA helicase II subunit 1 [Candida viswanathii]|uniref:DNA helicase n=1 Tax=Candida viswanathii TaxID=5486 RepID=A0A367YBC6_9ASCO|nr:ATP-dependent DNA helicase II subunit 1 [Candida viswanathii]
MSWNTQDASQDPSNTFQQYEIREGIAFLIEITPELLAPLSELNSNSQLYEILSSINDLMQELIMTSRGTGIGIYFYNCDASTTLRSMKSPRNFQRLFHLNVLNLLNMKKLSDLIQDVNVRSLHEIFKYKPSQSETQLTTVLSKMIDEFTNKKEFNKRRMFWITTNDKPYTEESTKEAIWRIIDDFYYYGFFIEPFFLSAGDKKFDFELFKDIFMNTNYLKRSQERALQEEEQERDLDVQQDIVRPWGFSKDSPIFKYSIVGEQIRQRIFRIKEVRRMQFTCDLILSDDGTVGGGLGCTIKAYTLYSHEQIKKNDLLLYTRDETLKKVFHESTLRQNGERIDVKNDKEKSVAQLREEAGIRKGYEIGGGEDIVFLNREQLEFLTNYTFDHRLEETDSFDKTFIDVTVDESEQGKPVVFSRAPYLKLIGFRDLLHFSPVYSCGAPTFITADTNNGMSSSSLKGGFTNSLDTFASLYRSCIKLKQYAVVFGCTRASSRPFLYALYPTVTTNSSKLIAGTEFPQGFLLIKLPWLEDVRALPADYIEMSKSETVQTDDELVGGFKELLPKFELQAYDPRDFPNPSMNYFYKVAKHEILQIDFHPDEKLLLKNDITMKRLAEIKRLINNDDSSIELLKKINLKLNEIQRTSAKKRPAIIVDPPKKKPKASVEVSDNEILVAWKNDTLVQFSMDQLRSFRKKFPDVKAASKKADLIENIKEFLDSRQKQ